MQAQIEAIRARVQECIQLAESKFSITMPKVDVRFDLTGRAAGMACMRYGHFYLRFNVNHIRLGGKTYEHLLNDTVPHEVAHTVCQAFPKFGRNHDAGWRRVCVALGGNGQRCYSENDAPEAVAAQRPYVYITTTGNEVRVTKVVHTKIQKGVVYTMKRGGGKLTRECQFSYMSAPAAESARKPVVITDTIKLGTGTVQVPLKQPSAKAASKAEQIRVELRSGKSADAVVEWAVAVLGMTRQLAKTYVKNNIGR